MITGSIDSDGDFLHNNSSDSCCTVDNTVYSMPIANVHQATKKFVSFFPNIQTYIFGIFSSRAYMVLPSTCLCHQFGSFSNFMKHFEAEENLYLTKLPLHAKSVMNSQFIIEGEPPFIPLASSLSAVKTGDCTQGEPHEDLCFDSHPNLIQ